MPINSARHFDWNVGDSRFHLRSSELVAIFDNLVHLFYINITDYIEGHTKAYRWKNAKVFC